MEKENKLLKSEYDRKLDDVNKLNSTMKNQLNDIIGKFKPEFEVLNVHTVLTLVNSEGSEAKYNRNHKIKVLVDSIIESVQCIGKIEEFKDNSGVIREEDTVSGKKFTTEFKTPHSKDATLEREVGFKLLNSFPDDKEFWEIKSYTPSSNNTFTLNFPNDRKYKKLRLYRLNGLRPEKVSLEFNSKSDNSVTIKLPKMISYETYRIEWLW